MSDIIEIPKANDNMGNFPCWVDTYDTKGNRIRPRIICKCGIVTNIGNHHIHADGRITASYFHEHPEKAEHPNNPHMGCGWHVFLKMKDWWGGEFGPKNDLPINQVN